jgi:hypothetical protein
MNWAWVVGVIVLAVWILSQFRTEEPPGEQRQRPGPGAGRPPQRPQSEVDKFLDEINRMRRRAAQEQRPRTGPPLPVITEVLPDEPEAAAAFERPRPAPPPPRVVEPPRPQPARRTAVARPAAAQAKPRVPESLPVADPAPPAVRPLPRLHRPKTSEAVLQLQALLRSPQSMQTAVLLHAVLGPPRCRGLHRSGRT